MLQLSTRSLRPLLLVTAISVAGSGALAAPAIAKATTAKATVAKTGAKGKKRIAPKPDLVVRNLVVEDLGDAFAIDAQVANLGTRHARASTTTVAISTDAVLSPGDEVLQDVALRRIPGLGSRQLTTEVDLPEALADGDLYLLVCADGSGKIKERVETNNCASELLTFSSDDEDASAIEDEDESVYDDGSGMGDAETGDAPEDVVAE